MYAFVFLDQQAAYHGALHAECAAIEGLLQCIKTVCSKVNIQAINSVHMYVASSYT